MMEKIIRSVVSLSFFFSLFFTFVLFFYRVCNISVRQLGSPTSESRPNLTNSTIEASSRKKFRRQGEKCEEYGKV